MQYKIEGGALPVVTCQLESGEKMISESGAMSWMSANMKMETSSNGGIKKAFGRMFSGESLFQNVYTAENGSGMIAFASCFPGSIRVLQITPDKPMIVQKKAFLASEQSVELSVFFQKKFKAGLLGGEGFIMQKLSGNGVAFIEIDGSAIEYELETGQQLIIDTGYLAAMDATCSIDIVAVPGIKNALFGGEGAFNTVVTGPGKVVLQSMPIINVANSIKPYLPTSSN